MNSIVARAVKVGVVASFAVGLAAYLSTGLRSLFLDVYLVVICAVLLLALVRTTRLKAPALAPSRFERVLREMQQGPTDTGEPALVRDVDLAVLGAFHLHVRLRPVLREIAAHRLRLHYGVDLDAEPGQARELVGSEAWDLVRPDRPPPADRLAPGPPLSTLAQVVTELERI
jgi:hypothetical protein